ncbi:MAG: putative nucleotide-diphospho-sugar transferase [Acidobacteriaceae bacterium]
MLVVDRLPKDLDISREQFELFPVEKLGIADFYSVAFKYDVLELNTNVKPTFLKTLLERGIDELVYLDPDIFVYRSLDSVFNAMEDSSIILTPHILSPVPDDGVSELILLSSGVFNLGFVAIKRTEETIKFLSWWENRCLNLAFSEQRVGLFVDQKWINLVPCLFESVKILKNPGCNMAYWNLHEREIHLEHGAWVVNRSNPLEFFHFSGVSIDGGDQISKFTDRFNLANRPDLRRVVEDYRLQLIEHGLRTFSSINYAFGTFDNGQYINRLTRSLYAANLEQFAGENPFSSSSKFYSWAKSARLLSDRDSANSYKLKSYRKNDTRLRILSVLYRLALRTLGADRYTVLLKYLSFTSILRNQSDVLAPSGPSDRRLESASFGSD